MPSTGQSDGLASYDAPHQLSRSRLLPPRWARPWPPWSRASTWSLPSAVTSWATTRPAKLPLRTPTSRSSAPAGSNRSRAAAANRRRAEIDSDPRYSAILSRGDRQAREAMRAGIQTHARAYGLAFRESEYDLEVSGQEFQANEWDAGGGNVVTAVPANPDPAAMADALSKLLPHGLRVKASQVRMRLGLDDPEDGDEILAGAGAPGAADDPDNPPTPAMARAMARAAVRGGGGGDSIHAAVEALLAGDAWELLMDPIVEPILAEAAAARARGESLAEFRDRRLPDLFARMDDTELIQTLRRMGFSARLSGDAGLGEDA